MTYTLPFARSFEPSSERHRALDQRMRTRLADSLLYIGESCRGIIPFDEKAFAASVAKIRAASVPALAFAAYGDLVLALDDDDLERAETLLAELIALVSAPVSSGMIGFGDPAQSPMFKRYERWMNTAQSIRILPLSDEKARAFAALLAEATGLLEKAAPDLAAETRLLAREIVAAEGGRSNDGMVFDGASSFLLWGAILLNVSTHHTRLALLQALVHESGHNLLFGLCADGSLVENEDEERYASPLRLDRRPMDGVFHATYVTARMHQGVNFVLKAGLVSGDEREEAERDLAQHEKGFADGLAIVRGHGKLTPLGDAVIGAAEAYMRANSRSAMPSEQQRPAPAAA